MRTLRGCFRAVRGSWRWALHHVAAVHGGHTPSPADMVPVRSTKEFNRLHAPSAWWPQSLFAGLHWWSSRASLPPPASSLKTLVAACWFSSEMSSGEARKSPAQMKTPIRSPRTGSASARCECAAPLCCCMGSNFRTRSRSVAPSSVVPGVLQSRRGPSKRLGKR